MLSRKCEVVTTRSILKCPQIQSEVGKHLPTLLSYESSIFSDSTH